MIDPGGIKIIKVWHELKVVQIEFNDEWLKHFKAMKTPPESERINLSKSGFIEHGGAKYYKIKDQEGWIDKAGKLWHEALKFEEPEQMNITSAWINIQQEKNYLPAHEHDGFLSGITYIDVPKQLADVDNKDGGVDLIFPREKKNFHFRPIEGRGLIFLAQTMHIVYPFNGPGIRRTLNYNMEIAK
tara:strand:+ start:20417 stop:20974 length:558 start_codon:yes stop_codon:yes gene_type:complete